MSDSIFQALAALQEPAAARQLSQQLGTDEAATGKAIAAALPMLVEALSRNTSGAEGASSLLAMLDRDHDGSILDDVLGSLAGSGGGGSDLLGDLLGAGQGSVENQIGRSTGLDAADVGRILAALAPLVLGALGRATRSGGLDASGLQRQVGEERRRLDVQTPGGLGPFARMLDFDGDGDAGDDVAELGAKILSGFFKG
jgi:hypothetical protein